MRCLRKANCVSEHAPVRTACVGNLRVILCSRSVVDRIRKGMCASIKADIAAHVPHPVVVAIQCNV
jgi:hypothetical protein